MDKIELPEGYRFEVSQETDWSMDPDEDVITSVQVAIIRTSRMRRLFKKEEAVAYAFTEISGDMPSRELTERLNDAYSRAHDTLNTLIG